MCCTQSTSVVVIMNCVWKKNCLSIVLLAVTCLDLTGVNGRKAETRVHWPVKDSSQNVDLDSAYDIALHLQHKLLMEFKHLKTQMASMQADAAADQDDPSEKSDDTHHRLNTLDWFGRSSQAEHLMGKLEEHDSYLRMMTQLFKDQLVSIAQRIENVLETQDEQLKRIESRIEALNDTLMLDHFVHHEELDIAQRTSDQLIKGKPDNEGIQSQ